ncbi:hypothetical protein Tsubulata_011011 [Turnera subulata]|uniref:BHLH domain-containing protein n=1 Tax=Turnera subulata TaxID=218843 RepID=A0A9Q0JKR7_9ROSI|nr:hypothetical protein Tsubulata_011011 [Turnera subulata]
MDSFFQELPDNVSWYEINQMLNPSAFVPYTNRPRSQILDGGSSSSGLSTSTNINKRMIDFMKRGWPPRSVNQEYDSKRHHGHIMSERLRREREKQGYLALHSLLPSGTKELKGYKERLERRNEELQERLEAMGYGTERSKKITVKVANPIISGVDSMLDVLNSLKSLEARTRSIQLNFSDHQEVVAVMEIDTELEAAEIEEAVKRTLRGS